jgi:serine protease Do
MSEIKNKIDDSATDKNGNQNKIMENQSDDEKKPKKGMVILKAVFNLSLMAILFGGIASAVFLVVTDTLKTDESVNNIYIATSIPYIGETEKNNDSASKDDKEVSDPVASAVDVSNVVESVSPALVTINGYKTISVDFKSNAISDEETAGAETAETEDAGEEDLGKEDPDTENSDEEASESKISADDMLLQVSETGVIVGQTADSVMILTSYSVLKDSETYSAIFNNGGEYEVFLKGYDEELDIAVLSMDFSEMTQEDIDYIRIINMGDSQAAKVGQLVIACNDRFFVGYISSASKKLNYGKVEYSILKTDITSETEKIILINSNAELLGLTTDSDILEGDILPVSMLKKRLLEIIQAEPLVATESEADLESEVIQDNKTE